MLEAYERSCKHKTTHQEVIKYQIDLANNLLITLKQLYNGTYQVGKYREFIIYEAKKNTISPFQR